MVQSVKKTVCQDVKVLKLAPFGQAGSMAGFWELALELPDWGSWQPGQFVMLKPVSWGIEPLWGRPFSICRVDGDSLRIFFQVVGRGTARLAQLCQGDLVTVWGPLGNGFAVEPDIPTLLLAGGIGIAPFVGYIQNHPKPDTLSLLFGHTQPLACYPYEYLADQVKADHFFEQGPGDLQEFIRLLRQVMGRHANGLALACGPTPFLRTVRSIALELGSRVQLSLENRMACGVGACLGCVCTSAAGTLGTGQQRPAYRKVCVDGPVFWASDMTFDEEE